MRCSGKRDDPQLLVWEEAGVGVWTVVGAGAGVRALTTVEDSFMMTRQNHVAHGREGLLALEQGN